MTAEQALVRLEIEELIAEFAYRIDHGQGESAADLFTEDGWYGYGPERRSAGREAIRQTYKARAAHGLRTTRHIFTNPRIEFANAGEAWVNSIMTLFAEDGAPPHPAKPLLVMDYDDVCVRENQRWLFRSRRITELFADPERAPVLPLQTSREATK